jgi:hypothetical protein
VGWGRGWGGGGGDGWELENAIGCAGEPQAPLYLHVQANDTAPGTGAAGCPHGTASWGLCMCACELSKDSQRIVWDVGWGMKYTNTTPVTTHSWPRQRLPVQGNSGELCERGPLPLIVEEHLGTGKRVRGCHKQWAPGVTTRARTSHNPPAPRTPLLGAPLRTWRLSTRWKRPMRTGNMAPVARAS